MESAEEDSFAVPGAVEPGQEGDADTRGRVGTYAHTSFNVCTMVNNHNRSCQLVYDLLEKPEKFFDHVKRVTCSVASSVIFGHRGSSTDSFWATVGNIMSSKSNDFADNPQCVYTAMDQVSSIGISPLVMPMLSNFTDQSGYGAGVVPSY
jgi:hypothetical protein